MVGAVFGQTEGLLGNELDLRDIVRGRPDASPEEFDAALGAVEQRRMTTGQLEAAIAGDRDED